LADLREKVKSLAALILMSSIATVVSAAQAPATEQEANQKKTAEPPAQQVVTEEAEIIIPPAPIVTKRKTDAILIPIEEAQPEARYEERPVVSSNARVGSMFGYRRDPFTRRSKFHSGVDIKARWGDPIGASQAGTVKFAGWYHGYGKIVIIDHGGGITTHYAHLSSFDVFVGDRVERGVIVGRAGSTGRATSPHLHYEVRIDGNPVNPFQTIALDPSNEYFTKTQPPVAPAGEAEQTRPRRVN
jgi:murein DD-endopeptidase MepM/ murein hydrolase activator NlpD